MPRKSVESERPARPSATRNVTLASLLLASVFVAVQTGCKPLKVNSLSDRIAASNYRDWSPQFSRLPYASAMPDGRIHLANVRNNLYLAENDFVPQYYDRDIELQDVRTVDFIIVPFQDAPYLAHTMVSFGLADDTYLGVSAEIRTEKGEEYSPMLGLSRQYELTYVVADERDVIRLRTRHRNAEVFLYRTTATPEQAQALFIDMLERVNRLASRPEFYNTVVNNCTTNVLNHVNRLRKDKLVFSWQVALPGYSDRFAYEQGLLDRSLPFEQLKQAARINDLADRYYDDPDFSSRIRQRIATNNDGL
jgi:hypothetical protein